MTPEQKDLLLKAEDSLKAARLLAKRGFHDFAVSRAYYTMFYVAEALLLTEGLSFSKHSAVISSFGQHFAKTGRVPLEFHRYLVDGQVLRHIGDYDSKPKMSQSDASKQIKRAKKFLDIAQQILSPFTDKPPKGK